MKTRENKIVAGLILFALFLHIYKLGSVPRGIYVDEMGMAYDAWSLGTYGVDRYMKSLPLYLTNFGGGQSILYCYLDILFVKLWGINEVTIRIPAVIFSMITCICGYFVIKKQWNQRTGILYLALFCIVPYFTMAGRIGLDCNLMLGMMVLFLFLFQEAVLSGKNRWYLAAGVAAGVTFYSYALSYLILPVFLVLLGIYLFYLKKTTIKQTVMLLLSAIVLAFPLFIVQLINIFDLLELQICGFTFTKLPFYRGNEITVSAIKENLQYLKDSLFGVDATQFGNFEPYSNLFPVSVPFIAVGAVVALTHCTDSLRNKEFHMSMPIICFIFLQLVFSCFITGVTTYRINAIFFPLTYLLVLGIKSIWETKQRWTKRFLQIIAVVYVCFFISFAHYYFTTYPQEVYPQKLFGAKMTEALEYLKQQPEDIRKRITYIGGVNESYIYYLGSCLESPYDYDIYSTLNFGNEEYQFYLPDTFVHDANYIVYAAKNEEIATLKAEGFTCIPMGEYVLGIYEWEDYERVPDTEGIVQVIWDTKVEDDDVMYLSGWCVNSKEQTSWDCMLLMVDGVPYYGERFDRKDVVDAFGVPGYLKCGISFEISAEVISQAKNVDLYCISHEKDICYTINIPFE